MWLLIRPGSLPDLHVKNVRGGRDGHLFLFFLLFGFREYSLKGLRWKEI